MTSTWWLYVMKTLLQNMKSSSVLSHVVVQNSLVVVQHSIINILYPITWFIW